MQWSFSYHSFVKFNDKKIWEPQQICVITSSVIKELYCIFDQKTNEVHEKMAFLAHAGNQNPDQFAHY